jgi:hypothetical protein
MQTLEFTRALTEIVKELKINELVSLMQPWLSSVNATPPLGEPDKDRFTELTYTSRAGYERLLMVPTTGKILQTLNLQDIYDFARLRRLQTMISSMTAASQVRGITEMYGLYETFRALQKFSQTCQILLEKEKIGTVTEGEEIIQLELRDEDGTGISPERLQQFVASVKELHSILAITNGIKDDRLTFKYFDSGSSLLIGILCAKVIAMALRFLLTEWRDKIRFIRYEKFDRNTRTITDALSAVTNLKKSVLDGVMTEEVAGIYRERILKEADRLVGIGASLPSRDATAEQEQLLLEAQDRRLLGTGGPEKVDDPAGGAGIDETSHRKMRGFDPDETDPST